VAPVSEPVQQGAGEALGAKNLRPFVESQVNREHEAMILIGPADDSEEQFGPRLGEGNISKFINHQLMEPLELFVQSQSLKPFFFPALKPKTEHFPLKCCIIGRNLKNKSSGRSLRFLGKHSICSQI
jgi:hypothetical protein